MLTLSILNDKIYLLYEYICRDWCYQEGSRDRFVDFHPRSGWSKRRQQAWSRVFGPAIQGQDHPRDRLTQIKIFWARKNVIGAPRTIYLCPFLIKIILVKPRPRSIKCLDQKCFWYLPSERVLTDDDHCVFFRADWTEADSRKDIRRLAHCRKLEVV